MHLFTDADVSKMWAPMLAWGVLSTVIGLLLLFNPGTTARLWVQIMALFWLVGGILDVIAAVSDRGAYWIWRIMGASISIIAGLFVLSEPLIGAIVTIQILFFVLVFNAIINGVINIVISLQRPRAPLLLLLGVFHIFIAGWLFLHPLVGMIALLAFFGVALTFYGVTAIILAVRFRNATPA